MAETADEKFDDMIASLIFGAFILMCIIAPSFCFKVDEEELARL